MIRRVLRFSILVLALAGAPFLAAQQPPTPPSPAPTAPASAGPRGGRGAAPVKSPEIAPDGRVTFRLRAPNAKEAVVAIGSTRLPMEKNEQGVWTATSDALTPDYYAYSFIVDGTTINDPVNRQLQTSFGSAQSMFVLPGAQPWLPGSGIPRGAIARHTFHSAVANDDRDFFVYTPPAYDPRRSRPYPVIFLLHGLGDDAERWMNFGGANVIMDNLIAQGKAVPSVVVTPLGYGVNNGPAGAMGAENITGYTTILLSEVLPAVERGYNVSRSREERAIAGLSMGGAETLFTALNHLDKFAWVGSFSGAFVMWPGATNPADAVPVVELAELLAQVARHRRRADGRSRCVRQDLSIARGEGELATADAVDHVRDGGLAVGGEPAVQGLVENEERAVHRGRSARRRPCLAVLAEGLRRIRAEGVSAALKFGQGGTPAGVEDPPPGAAWYERLQRLVGSATHRSIRQRWVPLECDRPSGEIHTGGSVGERP